jgi:hypothetical protein
MFNFFLGTGKSPSALVLPLRDLSSVNICRSLSTADCFIAWDKKPCLQLSNVFHVSKSVSILLKHVHVLLVLYGAVLYFAAGNCSVRWPKHESWRIAKLVTVLWVIINPQQSGYTYIPHINTPHHTTPHTTHLTTPHPTPPYTDTTKHTQLPNTTPVSLHEHNKTHANSNPICTAACSHNLYSYLFLLFYFSLVLSWALVLNIPSSTYVLVSCALFLKQLITDAKFPIHIQHFISQFYH